MIVTEDNYLLHYGVLRKSGRYPWGSGETQGERNSSFLSSVNSLKKDGLSESEIAKGFGISTTELRAARSIANNEQKQATIGMAQRLKDKGLSNVAIGEKMGINESSVRSLLSPGLKDRADVLQATASMLRDQVAKKSMIDVGSGVESHLGISQTKLATSVAVLREEGYTVHYVKVSQLGTGKETTVKVLAAPDTTYSEIYKNRENIKQIQDYSDDGGHTFLGIQTPISIDSSRVAVRYAEDGGTQADGVMYLRPGKDDLSIGSARYAQVRVAVDGTHYIKGMAMYKDDLPAGVDILFNTNKSKTTPKIGPKDNTVLKPMKDDPDNPFGAVIRQIKDPDTKKVTSAMNIVNDEGNWEGWSKSVSSQVLSKQSPTLAKQQLDMTYERRKQDLDEIMALTNPAVKRKLLDAYAESTDSAAVHLKAAALPRQASHVILPINTLKDTEVYAPNYRNGEKVVLIRYPHGGVFEIPELTVNNKHPEAKKLLGGARDAIGINHKVAERLSGADFDGDTVLVIPNGKGHIKTAPALIGLKGFDPQSTYPAYEGMPKMSPRTKQIEMGKVSNLITDMTIHGASSSELARAVRHSMVVIDAEKHNLNYKQSAADNGISALKVKYQSDPTNPGKTAYGSATLISRATSDIRVAERKNRTAGKGGPVDAVTGKRMYENTGATYTNAQGQTVVRSTKSVKLAETDNAHTLSSGTTIEKVYADHSNSLKALANQARLTSLRTSSAPYSPSAKAAYSKEVASLDAKLNLAIRNRPLERQAQVIANAVYAHKREANPDMDPSEMKKIKYQALAEARFRTGAKKQQIEFTQDEWNAVQAGALRNNKLNQILSNSDLDVVRQLATPKTVVLMTSAKQVRAQSMLDLGYTQAEVADALGVSVTTLKRGVTDG